MAEIRVTQLAAEVIAQQEEDELRITQLAAEVIATQSEDELRITQMVVEVIALDPFVADPYTGWGGEI